MLLRFAACGGVASRANAELKLTSAALKPPTRALAGLVWPFASSLSQNQTLRLHIRSVSPNMIATLLVLRCVWNPLS